MNKLVWLERLTIALILLYQLANKSPDEQLMGVDKMYYFIILGVYSLLLLVYEINFINNGLIEKTISFKKGNPEKLDLLITILFLGILAILFWANTSVNSRIPLLNYFVSIVYIIKTFLGIALYRRLKSIEEQN